MTTGSILYMDSIGIRADDAYFVAKYIQGVSQLLKQSGSF